MTTSSLLKFRDLLDAADTVVSLAKSEDDSPGSDDAFVTAVVRLHAAAEAARPFVAPPGPPAAPRWPGSEAMHG